MAKGVVKTPTKKKSQPKKTRKAASQKAESAVGTPNVAIRAVTGIYNTANAVFSGLKRRLSTAGN